MGRSDLLIKPVEFLFDLVDDIFSSQNPDIDKKTLKFNVLLGDYLLRRSNESKIKKCWFSNFIKADKVRVLRQKDRWDDAPPFNDRMCDIYKGLYLKMKGVYQNEESGFR